MTMRQAALTRAFGRSWRMRTRICGSTFLMERITNIHPAPQIYSDNVVPVGFKKPAPDDNGGDAA